MERELAAWFDAAHSGAGTPWLSAADADLLVRYALTRGEGVAMMEAAAYTCHEPPREAAWEIIGADPVGWNWDEHRDPARACALFRRKLRCAVEDGARLQYKLWLRKGGGA